MIANREMNKEVKVSELKDGCVQPARGPIVAAAESAIPATGIPAQEGSKMTVHVGKEAIDFEATAFVVGVGFKPVKLSDYRGQWIVLCFYPGDFTFV
jgi:peroxiredoxin (alkyl hydroperoxide reductase subunit C)